MKTCIVCQTDFIPCKPTSSFCSRNCVNLGQIKNHIRICKQCGKEFRLKNIADEKRGKGLYCSPLCAKRIYDFDQTYFEEINTPQKAYWLGFLYADGNVTKKQMTIRLQKRDKEHLLKLKTHLSSQHPIHEEVDAYVFYIGSIKLVTDLKTIGMVERKSLIIEYPTLLATLNRHFIRGVFDGDGCISINKKGYKKWSIFSGSKKFIDKISIVLEEAGIETRQYKQGKGFVLSISNKKNILNIQKYMYENSDVFLKRKYDKFLL